MGVLTLILTVSLAALPSFAAADELSFPHVKVAFCTVDSVHARALAQTMAAAREVYLDLGFNMPETVNLSITCGDGVSAGLSNDGENQLYLSIPSLDALAPPAKSKVFNLYGMCHELGHLAMYRTLLTNRDWMTNAAAEGWAHYIGSVVVDRVFAAKGESLWPDPYDYRQDGTARLEKQVASKSPDDTTVAAAQWQKLGAIIGLRGFAQLFAAWESAGVDPMRPSEVLAATLAKLQPNNEAALNEWWQASVPVLVQKLQVSDFRAEHAALASLSGNLVKVPANEGTRTGHHSYGGGSGHGRKFAIPSAGDWYITAVWICGSRYGDEKPPHNTFDIALSDADAKLISIWKGRYSSFRYEADDAWARFEVPPTRVPPSFYVTLNFHASASNGVYVAFDSNTKGNSIKSGPGKPPKPFGDGDWMIRAELDHPR
jgi:hypothetical protein